MQPSSVFLDIHPSLRLYEDDHFFIVRDRYPVSEGHLLVVSKQPRTDYFDLTDDEQHALPDAIQKARKLIEATLTPDGYNIGWNSGAAAGQTIMHFHCHVIPRFTGDCVNPRGGVRNSLPGKGNY